MPGPLETPETLEKVTKAARELGVYLQVWQEGQEGVQKFNVLQPCLSTWLHNFFRELKLETQRGQSADGRDSACRTLTFEDVLADAAEKSGAKAKDGDGNSEPPASRMALLAQARRCPRAREPLSSRSPYV